MKHLKKQTLILLSIASLFLVGLAAFAHLHKKEEKPSYSNLIVRPVLMRYVSFSRNIWTRGV